MTNYGSDAASFLVDTLFGFFILAVLLRLLLQWARADFYNPISQFLVKVTNPALVPLRRTVPSIGKMDTASVVLLIILQTLDLYLIQLINGTSMHIAGMLVLAVAKLLSLLLSVYLVTILVQVIISWVAPGSHNPVIALLHRLNEPLLRPARRIIPPISGMDLSPVLVIVALQLMTFLIVAPIMDLGRSLA